MNLLLILSLILLQSTVPAARDISQMANVEQDQSMLIYIIIAGYGPLLTVIGVLWRKWEDARTENKEATRARETLILTYAQEKQQMLLENNKISVQLGQLLSKLDKNQ